MKDGKFHIAIISTWVPTPNNSSGVFTREQADALVAGGNMVSLFMFQYLSLFSWLKKKMKGEPTSNWLKGKYITPIACDFINPMPTRFSAKPLEAQKNAFLKFAEKKFASYIKQNGKPDLIHHHEISDFCYITAHLSRTFGIPYVITEHSPFDPGVNHFNPYETKEERVEMIHKASARIAVSTFYKKQYERQFGVPFITIPNLVSDEFTKKTLPALPKKTNPFNFIHIGSLQKAKCQDILIKAFEDAFKSNADVHLNIVGTGTLENELKDLIASLGMEKQIHLPGYKSRVEILQLLDDSNVLVVSSEQETFSVAAAEALFRGNPVLTTRCGGPEDFITDKNGLLCNVNDVADMSEKLRRIYNTYSTYNHAQIAKDAIDLFSEQTVVNKLEELYRNIISS
jgi:glycosyltransferase involved in cell wall biosynthesis